MEARALRATTKNPCNLSPQFITTTTLRQLLRRRTTIIDLDSGHEPQILLNQISPSTDLINEILLLLPLKQLIRCKLVSKSWLFLISNPNFIKSHLRRTQDDETFIVESYDYKNEDDNSISLLNLRTRQLVADLKFPFSLGEFPRMPRFSIIGSACGIVCVCCTLDYVSYIYLWNPPTKHSKLISSHNILDANIRRRRTLGFGFDVIDDDFKVVRIVGQPFSAEVYSANINAWREIEPKPVNIPLDDKLNVCVNGFLCSPGYYGMDMVAFDLNKEVLNCAIKLPIIEAQITRTLYFETRITNLNDSVGYIIYRNIELDHINIQIWKLDDEACLRGDGGGIEASWTLMLNFDVNRTVMFVHSYFNTGDVLLMFADELPDDEVIDVWYLYNPDKKEAKNFPDSFYCDAIFKYTESLVSITGSKLVNWNGDENDD